MSTCLDSDHLREPSHYPHTIGKACMYNLSHRYICLCPSRLLKRHFVNFALIPVHQNKPLRPTPAQAQLRPRAAIFGHNMRLVPRCMSTMRSPCSSSCWRVTVHPPAQYEQNEKRARFHIPNTHHNLDLSIPKIPCYDPQRCCFRFGRTRDIPRSNSHFGLCFLRRYVASA